MTDETKLRLSSAELEKEMALAPKLAEKFLASDGAMRLERAKATLAAAKSKPNYDFIWEIPRGEPVRTQPSKGEYERKRDSLVQKGPTVAGALSFTWHMRTGHKGSGDIYISGNASTRLTVFDGTGDDANELGMWRMEIGAHDSPGCCFHTQVLGHDKEPPFPDWLPVPRLPTFPPTPMTCLEFLLTELFQLRWHNHVQRDSQPLRVWRSIQIPRLSSFLRWQLELIDKSTGSPLVDLKSFPRTDVLIGSA